MQNAACCVGLGAVAYVGGLLVYNAVAKQQPLSNNHKEIPNVTQPPPQIRTPQQGNGLYGYFNQWFYRGQPTNHALEL